MATEKTNSTAVAVANDSPALPAHLKDLKADKSMEQLHKYRGMSRMSVVQALSPPEIKSVYPEQSVILRPDMALVAEEGDPFGVVAVLFWPSWEHVRDPADNSGHFIIEQSRDPNSDVAIRACGPFSMRSEPYPADPQKIYRWRESFNFMVEIQDGPSAHAIAAVTFNRGSWKAGRALNNYLTRASDNAGGIPIWAMRFRMAAEKTHNNNNQSWWQLMHRPHSSPWISERDKPRLEAMNADAQNAIDAQSIMIADVDERSDSGIV